MPRSLRTLILVFVPVLDDVQARTDGLSKVLTELRTTLASATDLAQALTGTMGGIDTVVARLDRDPSKAADRKPST